MKAEAAKLAEARIVVVTIASAKVDLEEKEIVPKVDAVHALREPVKVVAKATAVIAASAVKDVRVAFVPISRRILNSKN